MVLVADLVADLVINGNTLVTSSVVVSRDSLLSVNGFDESISAVGWEDYHLWIKLAKLPGEFYKLNEALGICWQGDDNFDNPKRVLINLIQIEKYFEQELSNDVELSKIWWLSYTRARAYLKIDNRMLAKQSLNEVLFNESPYIYKLKSLYYWIFVLPFLSKTD